MRTLLILTLLIVAVGCKRESPASDVLVQGQPTTITISESNFTVRLENIVPIPRLITSNQAKKEQIRPAQPIADFDWTPGNIRIELSHRPIVFQTTNGKWALRFPEK